jgi:catechol 2,3-dioxygenase-like lactoylglutathione lyase family enzyme
MGLTQARAHATLPASDFERAKDFYARKLGLTPFPDTPGGAFYEAGDGDRFLLFPSAGVARADQLVVYGLQELQEKPPQASPLDIEPTPIVAHPFAAAPASAATAGRECPTEVPSLTLPVVLE